MKNKLFACTSKFLSLWLIQAFVLALAGPVTHNWPINPIDLDLSVGIEQEISILDAEKIQIGVPNKIEKNLNIEILSNHMWLTALKEFEKSRIILFAQPHGRLILQVSAVSSELSNQKITIQPPTEPISPAFDYPSIPSYGYVTLARWVVQQLYAPSRLLSELEGVSRIPVENSEFDFFRCGAKIPSLCAGGVVATPIASWQSTNYYVSAVAIQNKLTEPVVLDARELRGNWRAATFVHSLLRPEGYVGDNTVLILISDFPLEYAMKKSLKH